MWQQVIVYCIVAVAVLHMGGKYLPASWRRRLGGAVARRWPALGARLAARESGCGGGCSSCGACPDEAAPESGRVIKLRARE